MTAAPLQHPRRIIRHKKKKRPRTVRGRYLNAHVVHEVSNNTRSEGAAGIDVVLKYAPNKCTS